MATPVPDGYYIDVLLLPGGRDYIGVCYSDSSEQRVALVILFLLSQLQVNTCRLNCTTSSINKSLGV